MKLYLVRHGETVENIEGIVQGQIEGRLSDGGIEQVKLIAKRFEHEAIDAIYSSDLARAADTAKEIHRYHPNIPFHLVELLRERDFGPYDGKNGEEVGFDWDNMPPEVEPIEALYQRARTFLDEVYDAYPNGTILLVSHSGTLNALLSVLPGKSLEEEDYFPLKNTSVTILEMTDAGDCTLHLLNCVKHLE